MLEILRGIGAGIEEGRLEELASAFDGSKSFKAEAPVPVPATLKPEDIGPERIKDSRYSDLAAAAGDFIFPKARRSAAYAPAPMTTADSDRVFKMAADRDPALAAHMLRVGALSGLVAIQMGLPVRYAQATAWGGAFHDIGKMSPQVKKVIDKPGRLDEKERKVMGKHTRLGAGIVERLSDVPADIREIGRQVAMHHHESFDGSGYPTKLEGRDIPLAARIVHAVDFLDALMENRVYREGMDFAKAWSILEEREASFDPEVFAALRDVVRTVYPDVDASVSSTNAS